MSTNNPNQPPTGEFDLIKRYFSTADSSLLNSSVRLGIGDDAAIIACGASQLAISSDMLVEGRHFLSDADPFLLGQKALAVNLSDMAAMGAKPLGFTLSLALPAIDHEWLDQFSRGLLSQAQAFQCPLIGGDTTAGPLTLSITIVGEVDPDYTLTRHAALVGDDIWVSGHVGDARLALGALRNEWPMDALELQTIENRMHAPTPRVELGMKLRGVAHAAIDISDGLLGDLQHILERSKVGAKIHIDQVPKSKILLNQPPERQRLCALMGGDDYELCFTASPSVQAKIQKISKDLNLPITCIGQITDTHFMALLDHAGKELPETLTQQYLKSFDHFK